VGVTYLNSYTIKWVGVTYLNTYTIKWVGVTFYFDEDTVIVYKVMLGQYYSILPQKTCNMVKYRTERLSIYYATSKIIARSLKCQHIQT